MAVSLVTHPNNYNADLQALSDPLKIFQSFDFSFYDQMEFSTTSPQQHHQQQQSTHHHNDTTVTSGNIVPVQGQSHHCHHHGLNQENSSTHRHFVAVAAGLNQQQQSNGNTNVFHQNYDQVIDFVDSPPNSKDAWPDYQKPNNIHGPNIIDVQTIHGADGNAITNRKRRMDWEQLELNPTGISNNVTATTHSVTDAKVPNLGTSKEREKKKSSGRGSWTDDIDFDLNGEFANNGYLNNEAFLSLSSALTVLKQEIPSPSAVDVRKPVQSTPDATKIAQPTQQSAISLDERNEKRQQPSSNDVNNIDCKITNNSEISNNRQPANYQSQQSINNDTENSGGSNSTDMVGSFNQILKNHTKTNNNNSANNSPARSDSSKSDNLSDEYKFQYVLAAATSIATKSNEDTLTYLNQGQSYEIKLKKIGDLTPYRGKALKSIIKICFHERRLQYMEREQMQLWQASRPGERIIEVDVPLSYGLCHVSQPLNPNLLNTVEVIWDPMKEVGVYIKVNCISTEFTPKKHGGEKGVPFRIQIETYFENNNSENSSTKALHAAACQIKVFKLKGADRKHKQDREKIHKRPPSEQEKYQPSYECTILNDIPTDSLLPQGCYSPEYVKPTVSPLMPNSPVHIPKYEGIISFVNSSSSPIAINSVTSTNANYKLMDQNIVSPPQTDMEEYSAALTKESTTGQVAQWMTFHRLNSYVATFAHFSGSDILRMSKEDLVQICGLADGIRMFNTLHAKAITPRLTFYVSLDGSSYHAIYLVANTTKELIQKLFKLPGFYEQCASNTNGPDGNNVYPGWGMHSKYSGSGSNLFDATKLSIYINGPSGIHVLVTDEVLNNIKDDSLFALEVQNNKVLMKAVYKNENN